MSPNGSSAKMFTVLTMIILAVRFFDVVDCAPHRRSHLRTLRLCSKKLSDALYLVCSGKGYNEPFSYSAEDQAATQHATPRVSNGPGLVEECCYHSCSYVQLEQYCKAGGSSAEETKRATTDSRDVM